MEGLSVRFPHTPVLAGECSWKLPYTMIVTGHVLSVVFLFIFEIT
jgi:hypothetical protein